MNINNKKLSKKDDWDRKWWSFLHHSWLLLEAIIVATAATLGWRWLWLNDYYICKEDEAIVIGGLAIILTAVYTIAVGSIFPPTLEKYRVVMSCVLDQENPESRRKFLSNKDEHMPTKIGLLIFLSSLLLVGTFMMFDYSKEISGIVLVFIVSFIFTFLGLVLDNLDNPTRSRWLRQRIQAYLLFEDVDEALVLKSGGKVKPKPQPRRKGKRRRGNHG